jgi:hypothetical protein
MDSVTMACVQEQENRDRCPVTMGII